MKHLNTDDKQLPLKPASKLRLRLRGAIVLTFVGSLLGLAFYLNPAQLGNPYQITYTFLKPCGILLKYGYPCPTCYMTRSFAYMMNGRPDLAFLAQPFGALLSLLVMYLGWGALVVLITARPWRPFWHPWSKKKLFLALGIAFLAGWIFRLIYGTFITHEFPL